jgi:hypothetical protein
MMTEQGLLPYMMMGKRLPGAPMQPPGKPMQVPPVAFPSPQQPLPQTSGPDVNYPGGMQNFWTNNGRTFNIPGAQALAERGPMPGAGPMLPSDWRSTSFPTPDEERRMNKVPFQTPIMGRTGNEVAGTVIPLIGKDGRWDIDNIGKNLLNPGGIFGLFG